MRTACRGFRWTVVCLVSSLVGTGAFSEAEVENEPQSVEFRQAPAAPEKSKRELREEQGLGVKHTRIRLELTPTTAYHSGNHSRSGDYGLRTNVDFEIPVLEHMTVAPRVVPLMYYNENGDGNNNFFLFGIGIVLRGYSNGKEQRGWFGEGGAHLFGQTAKFEGNTGTFNFMEELGFGYMFKNGVHAAAKVCHFSNAGLSAGNSGVNSVGIGFGYSFKR